MAHNRCLISLYINVGAETQKKSFRLKFLKHLGPRRGFFKVDAIHVKTLQIDWQTSKFLTSKIVLAFLCRILLQQFCDTSTKTEDTPLS